MLTCVKVLGLHLRLPRHDRENISVWLAKILHFVSIFRRPIGVRDRGV